MLLEHCIIAPKEGKNKGERRIMSQQPIRSQYSGISMREMKSSNNKSSSTGIEDERRDDTNDESLMKQNQQQQQLLQTSNNSTDKMHHHHHPPRPRNNSVDNDDNDDDDDDDDSSDPNNNSYENESLGLVYSIHSSSNGSNYNKVNRSNSSPRRSFYSSHRQFSNSQHQYNQHNHQQQDQHHHHQQQQQQRWKRLPITDDEYFDDIDELNSTDEWNSSTTNIMSTYYNPVPTKRIRRIGICVFLVAILAVLIPRSAKKHITGSDLLDAPQAAKKIKGTPQYTCPVIKSNEEDDEENDHDNDNNNEHDNDTRTKNTTNSKSLSDNETNSSSSATTTSSTSSISDSIPTTPASNDYDVTIVQEMEAFALNVSSNLDYYVTNYQNLTINKLHLLPYITHGQQQQQQQESTNNTSTDPAVANYTYEQIKDSIRNWKTSKFLANLKTGDSLYQSGAGIGWNLLLTLEILQEENDAHYISDLHLYGNDHIPVVAQLANIVLDAIFDSATTNPSRNNGYIAKRGVVCSADSTSLHTFIPEASFDLVYASSIPALPDPLQLLMNSIGEQSNNNKTNNDTPSITSDNMYAELCSDKNKKDWKVQKLLQLAQQHQNDWYATWVTEMIYIAKAGAPIIIEYVGQPYCTSTTHEDGGNSSNNGTPNPYNVIVGVAKLFWEQAIIQYNWNIDPHSLIIEDDVLFPSTYHVFMRTNDS